MRRRRVLPGFGLSLGTSVLFVSLVLLLPMTALVVQLSELTWAQYWAILTHPQTTAAFRVTILSAFWASVINALLGLLLAWILVRYRFPGRRLLDGLIDLPFVLPTAVAGLTLSALFAADGWYGAVLAPFGIKVSYTWLGIVAAMAFTSIPFVVRSVQPVLAEVNRSCEEAALTLGASRLQIFRRVILPEIAPALAAGTVLAFCRSLGEFGAIIFISGNIAFETEVLSLAIFMRPISCLSVLHAASGVRHECAIAGKSSDARAVGAHWSGHPRGRSLPGRAACLHLYSGVSEGDCSGS